MTKASSPTKALKKAKKAFLTAGEGGLSPTSSSCPQVGFTDIPRNNPIRLLYHPYSNNTTGLEWLDFFKTSCRLDKKGMSCLWRNVILMKVCHDYEGMSYLWRFVILIKVRNTIEGVSYLWRYVILMKVGHTYEGVSYLWRYVILIKVCHTYEGMSH